MVTVIAPYVGFLWTQWKATPIVDLERRALLKHLMEELDKNPRKWLFFEETVEDLLLNIFEHSELAFPPVGFMTNDTRVQEEMHTGHNSPSRYAEVRTYDNSEFVTCWHPAMSLSPGHDNYYGMFTLEKGDSIYAWVDTLSRNVVADYHKVCSISLI